MFLSFYLKKIQFKSHIFTFFYRFYLLFWNLSNTRGTNLEYIEDKQFKKKR
jgi:hypothetical protein